MSLESQVVCTCRYSCVSLFMSHSDGDACIINDSHRMWVLFKSFRTYYTVLECSYRCCQWWFLRDFKTFKISSVGMIIALAIKMHELALMKLSNLSLPDFTDHGYSGSAYHYCAVDSVASCCNICVRFNRLFLCSNCGDLKKLHIFS